MTSSSSGTGSAMHLSLELFKGVTGIDVVHVPYKGGGPSMTAIVSGEVAMSFNTPAAVSTHIQSGRVRGLAITGAKRYAALADIPTLVESGIKGVEADPFWGLVTPAGTPQHVVTRLHELWTKHINAPDMRVRLLEMGFVPVANTPAEFSTQIKNDIAKWTKVIKAAGIQAQ